MHMISNQILVPCFILNILKYHAPNAAGQARCKASPAPAGSATFSSMMPPSHEANADEPNESDQQAEDSEWCCP